LTVYEKVGVYREEKEGREGGREEEGMDYKCVRKYVNVRFQLQWQVRVGVELLILRVHHNRQRRLCSYN